MTTDFALSVTEFVALLNQTLEYAYPNVTVTGELVNFKVSKNRWVYFDLKDEESTVRCFGTVYQLPGPLQDGMLLAVKAVPKLHQLYGFSLNILNIQPVGEGSIKKAAALLEAKLAAEGLFDPDRKRALPYPPASIGLITSAESAAYRDFQKVVDARWGGLGITLIDVQVQGEAASGQIVAAIEQFNQQAKPPEVLVITRGGGSPEDLQAFSTEQVVRAVAASRIPTLVAIGHEIDLSLSERAADMRASTPSNAAELLVPDRKALIAGLQTYKVQLARSTMQVLENAKEGLSGARSVLHDLAGQAAVTARRNLAYRQKLLAAFDPEAALRRGYALVRQEGKLARLPNLRPGDAVAIHFAEGAADATITDVRMKQEQS